MAGVHRVQHVPAARVPKGKAGMRQTSYATVVVLDDIAVSAPPVIRRGDPGVHVETARGTGPGGQHRNTSDTAVRAWHQDHPGIVVTRNSGRSQTVNVDAALAELAARIAARQRADERAAVNASRREQAELDVAFTHSQFEGFVRHHASGRKWPLRAWEQGRFGQPS
jgi:protein subunit release factor A